MLTKMQKKPNFSHFLFISSCTSKYVGEYCGYLNPCHTSSGPRCQNGGVCEVDYSNAMPTFRCRCAIGFTASLCEITERNACELDPCQNGGSCQLKTLDDFVCVCAQGYTGKCFDSDDFFLQISVVDLQVIPIKVLICFSVHFSHINRMQAHIVKSKICALLHRATTVALAYHCPAVILNVSAQRDSEAKPVRTMWTNVKRCLAHMVALAVIHLDHISKYKIGFSLCFVCLA